MSHNYKELKIWTLGKQIAIDVYFLTKNFPSDEKFGLMAQLRRAAISIPSNIAEGAGRNNDSEFNHFLGIATGSAYELETQLIIAQEVSLIENEKAENTLEKVNELKKMLYGFKQKFNAKNSKTLTDTNQIKN
jgi:four helix bundle protein